jgi:hypothetical protein
MRLVTVVLACAFSSVVLAAPPPPPRITVAATDIRQLEFNWESVPGVQTYELWFRSAPGAPWVKYGERNARRSPMFRIAEPVHLLNWAGATYYVKACNPTGCSSSNHVSVDGEQLNAMGFIKPKAPTGHLMFGSHVALSADGNTMAVTTGETMGTVENSLVVHVYRKTTATSGWRREARLLPSYVRDYTQDAYDNDNIALSADGNLLVLGSFKEPASRAGLPENAGAVYLFRRTGTEWRLAQTLKGAGTDNDRFGSHVEIDDAARTLVVWHQTPGNRYEPGTLEIYRDAEGDSSDQFVHDRTLPVPPRLFEGDISWCDAISLSGDGQTLIRTCVRDNGAQGTTHVYTGPGFTEAAPLPSAWQSGMDLSYDGKMALLQNVGGAEVYRLTTQGWVLDGTLRGFAGEMISSVRHVAISSDGKIAAVGNPLDYNIGIGPVYPPYQVGEDEFGGNGGVTIFQRKASGWEFRRLVKPGSHHRGLAGWSIALGANGKVLAVGAPQDPSAATGIDGDREDDSAPLRGAVWLY